jgi:hypothetical protein
MSTKLLASALAGSFALAAAAPGPVLALNYAGSHHHAYGYQSYSYGLHGTFLRGARDPDANVRFELNRDANRGRS